MPETTLREATRSLYEAIDKQNGPHPYVQAIGEGVDRIYVYLTRKPMGHEHAIPTSWNGWPVETRVIGRLKIGG